MADVFVSYARRDNQPPPPDPNGFVTRLNDALVAQGFSVWMDKRDIIPAGHFEQDIEKGITESDAFLLVMSPASLDPNSFCAREIAIALRQNKRLIPVVRADASAAAPVPEDFRDLDWIFARTDDEFPDAVEKIARVLRSGDQRYIHTHSDLLARARAWENRGKPNALLLRGGHLADGTGWLQTSATVISGRPIEPRPTALQTEYLLASEAAARARQRVTTAVTAVALVIMTGLAIAALINARIADRRALESRSLALAANAQSVADRDGELALALAVEAVSIDDPPPLAQAVLSRYAYRGGQIMMRIDGTGDPAIASDGDYLSASAYAADGSALALGMNSGAVSLWDAATTTLIRRLPVQPDVIGTLAFSPDGTRLMIAVGDRINERFHSLRLWNLADDTFTTLAMEPDPVHYAAFTADGSKIVAVSGGGTARAWDAASGEALWTTQTHTFFVPALFATGALTPDGRMLYVTSRTDNSIYALDTGTGTIVRTVTLASPIASTLGCFDIIMHPDGQRIACVPNLADPPGLFLHDLDSGALLAQYQPLEANIFFGTQFSRDGSRLAAAVGNTIRLWETETGAVRHTYAIDDTSITLAFAPDGDTVLYDASRGVIGVLDALLRPGAQDGERLALGNGSNFLTYDPARGGFWIARIGTLMLIDETDYGVRLEMRTGDQPFDMVMLPDGGAILAEENGRLSRWASDALVPGGAPTWTVDEGGTFAMMRINDAGTRLLTVQADARRFTVWDTATGTPTVWEDLPIAIDNAHLSPDGAQIAATGCTDDACTRRAFVVWDAATRAVRHTLDDRRYFALAVSPDSRTWAVADGEATIALIDATSGGRSGDLYGHIDSIGTMVFSPDGARLISAEIHPLGRLFVWDVAARAAVRELQAGRQVMDGMLSAAGDRFFTLDFTDNSLTQLGLTRWRLDDSLESLLSWTEANRLWRPFSCGERARYAIAPLCDTSADPPPTRTPYPLIAAAPTRTPFPRTATPTHTASPPPTATPTTAPYSYRQLYSAWWSPDGTRILAGEQSGFVVVWEVASGRELFRLEGHDVIPQFDGARARWSPDGARLVTYSLEETAVIWDGFTGERLVTLTGHTGDVYRAAWSPDGARIVTVGADETARVWESRTGQAIAVLAGHSAPISWVNFSPSGARIATAGEDGTARIWDAASGEELFSLAGREPSPFLADGRVEVLDVAWSPDGNTLAASGTDGLAILWDARTGERGLTLTVPQNVEGIEGVNSNWVNAAFFSPDGSRIALHTAFTTGSVWDARTGEQLYALTGHESDLMVMARWSPDGARLLTAGTDGTIRVRDGLTGAELLVMDHGANVFSADWSPDGARIVSAALDGTARLWDAVTGVELPFLSGVGPVSADAAVPNMMGTAMVPFETDVAEVMATGGLFVRTPTASP